MTKTIKQELLEVGMLEEEIANYSSDLYVLKNEISDKFVDSYEFKCNVTTFTSRIDGKTWYEIPFGYANEWYIEKCLP